MHYIFYKPKRDYYLIYALLSLNSFTWVQISALGFELRCKCKLAILTTSLNQTGEGFESAA